nr:MAG TPA: hypothetical protein [Bacteriophage sp.]
MLPWRYYEGCVVSKFQLGLSENKNTHFFSANRPDGYCQGDLTIRKN